MSALIIDGRALAARLRTDIFEQVQAFRKQHAYAPTLAIVRIGNDPASISYARQVDRALTDVGMGYQLHILPPEATYESVQMLLSKLGRDNDVHGVMLQRPLPAEIDGEKLMAQFPAFKDVEGVSPANVGFLFQNRGNFFPTSTPSAAMEILSHYRIPLDGKHAVVVGRSIILGRPMALLLLHRNATVTLCHSHTTDLKTYTQEADVLIAAAGVHHIIKQDMVKQGATVIDFGVNYVDGQVVGDVDFENVKEIAGAITPVPGGTGPVTTVMLMRNTLNAAKQQVRIERE